MPFLQFRIPVERPKEEWPRPIAHKIMRRRRPLSSHCRITDHSEPWIRNP